MMSKDSIKIFMQLSIVFYASAFIVFMHTLSFSAGISTDGTLGPVTTLTPEGFLGKNYSIPASLGQQKGANLFHSFREFNVDTGYRATFYGPDGIANVIGRVTGGNASWIDGKLACNIDGANLWLLNPFGILFGPNAYLDVKGSFYASTADSLQFSDGSIFYTDPLKNSTLSVAAPSAFGFMSDNPADISVKGSVLEVPNGKGISLIGGDIAIVDGLLYAPGGKVSLASLKSPGKVELDTDGLKMTQSSELGDISISNSIENEDAFNIGVSNYSNSDVRSGVDIHCKTFSMDNSNIGSINYSDTTASGNILLSADESVSINNSRILNASEGNAPGGNIEIKTSQLILNNASMFNVSFGNAAGGNIVIHTDSLTLSNAGQLSTFSYGAGNGASIDIDAKEIMISGGYEIDNDIQLSIIGSIMTEDSTGNSGDVNILCKSLIISDGGVISTTTLGKGNSGNIDIHAETIRIDGGLMSPDKFYFSRITSQANNSGYSGKAGDINIDSETLAISNGGEIVASAFGEGESGTITIHAKAIIVEGGFDTMSKFYSSVIGSTTISNGNPGMIDMDVGSLSLIDGGLITAWTSGSGNGGNITIDADKILVKGGIETTEGVELSSITCDSGSEASGHAGTLDIHTNSLELSNGGRLNAGTLGSGNAGNINISANQISVDGGFEAKSGFFLSGITCQTYSSGNAGSLDIHSEIIKILNGGQISASTLGSGNGGSISIHSKDISIDGGLLDHDEIALSKISCKTTSTGNAGSLNIETDSLELSNGGQLTAMTSGSGDGGNIAIKANQISISGQFQDSNEVYPSIISCIADNATAGKAGSVDIQANMLSTSNGGEISVASYGKESGGDITIDVKTLNMNSGSAITSASTDIGNAGNIDLTVTDRLECRNSTISTESLLADGGNITIRNTGFIVWLVESAISATVGGGPQTSGGNIRINSPYIVIRDSDVIANAYEGKGGSIKITSGTYLADWTSTISASSTRGISGEVDVNSPLVDLSGLLSPLPTAFMDVTGLLANDCETHYKHRKVSSLVVKGRDALPAQPGDLLPGAVIME